MIRSILWVLFSLVGLACIAQTAQSIFEYLSSVLIPMENKSLVLIVENGRCFIWIYYVFLGAHFKNISRMESPVSWLSSFCNASTLTAICCGNLFNSSAILFRPAGQQ